MDVQGQQNGVIHDGRDESVIIQDVHTSDRLSTVGPNALVIGAQAGLLPRFLPLRFECSSMRTFMQLNASPTWNNARLNH